MCLARIRFVSVLAILVLAKPPARLAAHTDLISPNGGETLIGGDPFIIEWTVAVPHNLENWDLWYSTSSEEGPWIDIAMDLPAGDPNQGSQHLFDWTVPATAANQAWVRVRMDNGGKDYYDISDSPFSIRVETLACDFDGDGNCGVSDLNAMLAVGPIQPGVAATGNSQFDLDGDGTVNNADVDRWLADAASENGLGSPYQRGDANLDGATNQEDFSGWNANKFTSTLRWDQGDFNGDGQNNGRDFLYWNRSKQSSSGPAAVPEPHVQLLVTFASCLCIMGIVRRIN